MLATAHSESFFNKLLDGHSVTEWAHSALHLYPQGFRIIEFTYLFMFTLTAGCIITLGVSYGPRRAMQFVGAGLTGSYISLVCFYLIPASGPYLFDSSSVWPKNSMIYLLQMRNNPHFLLPGHGFHPALTGADYLVAFPCMHLVEVILMWWFLRKNKGLAWLVGFYGVILMPCIFLLEEHYLVVDVIAAIPLSMIVIAMIEAGKDARIPAS